MKMCLGMKLELHPFLTSTVGGDEWRASRSDRFTTEEIPAGTRWIGDWPGPGPAPRCGEKKHLLQLWESSPDFSVVELEAWVLCKLSYPVYKQTRCPVSSIKEKCTKVYGCSL
jgi:hypothetical protein